MEFIIALVAMPIGIAVFAVWCAFRDKARK